MSPSLPWEVIERIIDHSVPHRKTLRNFSLTCRDLRPRALYLIVTDAVLWKRDRIFDFCDFLQAKPDMKPFVRSIILPLSGFAPFPLLHILPNLSELTLGYPPPDVQFPRTRDGGGRDQRFTDLEPHGGARVQNQSVLTCCQQLGKGIRTLHLSALTFPTHLELCRILLAFTNLTHLVCTDVFIDSEGNPALPGVIKRRLSERSRLQTLTIEFTQFQTASRSDWGYLMPDSASVGALLLDSGVGQPTIEKITVEVFKSFEVSNLSCRSRLRSLVLSLPFNSLKAITHTAMILDELHHPTLKNVTIRFHGFHGLDFEVDDPKLYAKLERALLRFAEPRITWAIRNSRTGRKSFWTQELGRCFPVLYERSALGMEMAFRTGTGDDPGYLRGHEYGVNALVASPDGKWVASGSSDGSIIIWDTSSGEIAHQWIAHNYFQVWSLAFSPDSGHLVSGSRGSGKVLIWDLHGAVYAILEGHTRSVWSCAWSPNGDVIASGSHDRTARLWDLHASQQRHVLETPYHVELVAFSPDGRWLMSFHHKIPGFQINIWDAVSGTLHMSLSSESDNARIGSGPAPPPPPPLAHLSDYRLVSFDPKSTRLATALDPLTATVWNVETGSKLFTARDVGRTTDITFSPDGQLVLTASQEHTMKIWDAYTGLQLFSLEGHRDIISRTLFSPCGTYIASASLDHTVRLWRTRDRSPIATFSDHSVRASHITFSADGKSLWSGASDGTVTMRRMSDIISMDAQEDIPPSDSCPALHP